MIFLFGLNETDAYREGVDVTSDFIAEAVKVLETGGVFFGGDDTFRRDHRSEGLVDECYVLGLEVVVVSKGEGGDVGCLLAQVFF